MFLEIFLALFLLFQQVVHLGLQLTKALLGYGYPKL